MRDKVTIAVSKNMYKFIPKSHVSFLALPKFLDGFARTRFLIKSVYLLKLKILQLQKLFFSI